MARAMEELVPMAHYASSWCWSWWAAFFFVRRTLLSFFFLLLLSRLPLRPNLISIDYVLLSNFETISPLIII